MTGDTSANQAAQSMLSTFHNFTTRLIKVNEYLPVSSQESAATKIPKPSFTFHNKGWLAATGGKCQ